MKGLLLVVFVVIIAWWVFRGNGEEDYEYGYGDGNATGYNAACGFTAYPILADWDNEDYSRGYREGLVDGAAECAKEGSN